MFAWVIVVAAAVAALLFAARRRRGKAQPGLKPFTSINGPPQSWPLGNTREYMSDSKLLPRTFITFLKWSIQYGDEGLMRTRFFTPQGKFIDNVVVLDPSLVARISGLPKSPLYSTFRPLGSHSGVDTIFTSLDHGQQWKNTRKTTAHSFSTEALKMRFPAVVDKATILTAQLRRFGPDKPIACQEAMSRLMLDMLLATGGFGVELNALDFKPCGLLDELEWCLAETSRRIANPLHALKVRLLPWTQAYQDSALHFARLHGHWAAICESMLSEPPPAEDDVRIAAALRRITSASTGRPLEGDELQAEVATLALAAIDTSSNTLCFALTCIAYHAHVQQGIFEELQQQGLAAVGDSTPRTLTYADLGSLKYLEAVLQETMRMFPVGFAGTRRRAAEPIELAGYEIPAGTVISPNTYAMHRLPANFPQPDKFVPDRWLEGREIAVGNKHAYMPFSFGLRNCPGQRLALMQMMATLAIVLGSFHVRVADSMGSWDNLSERLMGKFTLSLKGDAQLHFTPRNHPTK